MIRCSSFAEKAMADEVLHGFGFLGHKGGKDGGGFAKTKIYDSALSALS